MKKLFYGGLSILAIITIVGMIALSNASAETVTTSASDKPTLLTNANNVLGLNNKDETVYVITDADGAKQSVFVGDTLHTGNEELPFRLNVQYYLDGTALPADEIAGKSGHIRIEYSYNSVQSYQGAKVPFIAITGILLNDEHSFSNLKVENGRIIDDGSRLAVVGYALLMGVNETLNIHDLPDSFAIEVDAHDFTMPESYTLVTNEVFANIDTSVLVDVDSVVGAINNLASGLDTIIAGASDLNNGLQVLVEKSGDLVTGAQQLNDGLAELASNNDALNGGAKKVFDSLLLQASNTINTRLYEMFSPMIIAQYAQYGITPSDEQITAGITNALAEYKIEYPINLTIENYDTILDNLTGLLVKQSADTTELSSAKKSLDEYAEFYYGVLNYTTGVSLSANGANALASGTIALVDGEKALRNGANMLVDGLQTFKNTGIDKIVEVANNDIAGFTRNARIIVQSANSYHYFKNPSATSVKFIIKTTSVR